MNSENPLQGRNNLWGVKISVENFKANPKVLVPKEETFPVPLKYIDATRSTHTNLNVCKKHRIDDCWECGSEWKFIGRFEQPFVRVLERIHEVHMIERQPPTGYMWPGRR